MSSKRKRSPLDLLGGIDDLFGLSEVESPTDTVGNHESSALPHTLPINLETLSTRRSSTSPTTSPPRRRPRVYNSAEVSSPSSPAAVSFDTVNNSTVTTATDSLGGDEMDLLRRKDEELSDMALFLAKAIAETPSLACLRELVALLEKVGVARIALALKRCEDTEVFLHSLFLAQPSVATRALLLRLLLEFLHLIDAEAFFQCSILDFLVASLAPPKDNAPPTPSPLTGSAAALSTSATPTATHWSARKKKVAPTFETASVTQQIEKELEGRVCALCSCSTLGDSPLLQKGGTEPTSTSTALLALRALLSLVFEHNRSLALSSASSAHAAPLLLVRAGGLERVVELLRDDDTRGAALALLEVLTASEVLRCERARLRQLVPPLLKLLCSDPLPSSGSTNTSTAGTQVPVLKVLTNITNLLPSVLGETNTARLFVAFLHKVLSSSPATNSTAGNTDGEERETFALCCAINVLKYEARDSVAAVPAFTAAFMESPGLLSSVARGMAMRYHSSDASQLVLSGYAALLLGALSLVNVPTADPPSLRVPVMTAVAAAARGTRIGHSTDHQPMRIVAAIIQEFLLFQSASGTLTRDALVEMDSLVARIREHNNIALTEEASAEAITVEENEDNSDDEVTLGELL